MNNLIIFLLLISCSFLWAIHPVINRLIFHKIDPIHFFIITSVLLGLICLPFIFLVDFKIINEQPKYLIAWPLISIIANILFFYCIGYSKNELSAIVCIQNVLFLIFVMIISYFIFQENLNNKQIVGMILGFLSVYLLT